MRALETRLTRVDPGSAGAAGEMTALFHHLPPLYFTPSSLHSLASQGTGHYYSLHTTENVCRSRVISHGEANRVHGVVDGHRLF